MRTFFLVALFASLVALSACKDNSTNTTNTTVDTSQTKIITIIPDSSNDYFYSFDNNAAVPIANKAQSGWDIRVNHVFGGGRTIQIDVFFNSGAVNSSGLSAAYVVDTTFDNVSTVNPAKFRNDSISTTGRIVSTQLDGTGLFVYNQATHMISTNPQKTIIVRTASGAYYKVQFVSINTPASTSALTSFVIRYLKANGTRLK